MIDKLSGILEDNSSNEAIILIGGISFKIKMSINSLDSLPKIGEKVKIFTYLHVREDLLELFGFLKNAERETFELLISISGIGPKLALTILSGVKTDILKKSIIAGDIKALTKIPGVGNKTAKRIIIELKEKFINIDSSSLGFSDNKENSELFKDALNALAALGYKKNHAHNVCTELEKENLMKGELESVIKLALGKLMS